MNDPRWVIKRIRAATVIQTYRRAQLARRDFDVEKLKINDFIRITIFFDAENYKFRMKILYDFNLSFIVPNQQF